MRNRQMSMIRASFSFLAAAVTIGMSQEWATWAFEQHRYWKHVPAALLAAISSFEADKDWKRVERIMGLTYEEL